MKPPKEVWVLITKTGRAWWVSESVEPTPEEKHWVKYVLAPKRRKAKKVRK